MENTTPEMTPAELLASSEKLQLLAKKIEGLSDNEMHEHCDGLTAKERDAIGCCCEF